MSVIVLDDRQIKTSENYAGRVSPYPRNSPLVQLYPVDRYLAHGWRPKGAFASTRSRIVAFGSCFADGPKSVRSPRSCPAGWIWLANPYQRQGGRTRHA
jgi:hypothetical protein